VEVLHAGEAPQAPDNAEDSAQSRSDGAVPGPGDAPARSVEDLTAAGPEEDLAGSAEDDIPPHVPDDAIDQLTADLAAFCFDRLESGVVLGNEGHELAGTNNLEDELQVRFKSQRVDKTRILMLDPFRLRRAWWRHMLPMRLR